jgi:glyceraldehyde-3-phosphate dehydrogenase/erythrose-4-phosphate dehydrogenase
LVTTAEEVNRKLLDAIERDLKSGMLDVVPDGIDFTTSDVVGYIASGVFDPAKTIVIPKDNGTSTAHLFSWYDNEFGYASGLLRLAQSVGA